MFAQLALLTTPVTRSHHTARQTSIAQHKKREHRQKHKRHLSSLNIREEIVSGIKDKYAAKDQMGRYLSQSGGGGGAWLPSDLMVEEGR